MCVYTLVKIQHMYVHLINLLLNFILNYPNKLIIQFGLCPHTLHITALINLVIYLSIRWGSFLIQHLKNVELSHNIEQSQVLHSDKCLHRQQ